MSSFACRARHILFGCAASAIAAMLAATPAYAQSTDTEPAGPLHIMSEQITLNAPVTADAGNADVRIDGGRLLGSTVELGDNDVTTSARANRATSILISSGVPVSAVPTALSAGGQGLSGRGRALVATEQRLRGSPVRARIAGSRIALESQDMVRSSVQVMRNDREAAALGNDASGSIDLTQGASNSGAGVVTLQRADGQSGIFAHAIADTELVAATVSGGTLAVRDNLVRSISAGSSLVAALSVDAPALTAPAGSSTASSVPHHSTENAIVAAPWSILSDQMTVGRVEAGSSGRDGAPYRVSIAGALEATNVANDANALVSGGYGNRSANALTLKVASITRERASEGSSDGPLANVTNVQRVGDAGIASSAEGDVATSVTGNVAGSAVAVSGNVARAEAVGNVAEGNRLDVVASLADAPGFGPVFAPLGTMRTDEDGTATASAAFSIQNVQAHGRGAITATTSGAATLAISGEVDHSDLRSDSNVRTLAATGNDAANALTLKVPTLRASAGVNNVQSSDGRLRAAAGTGGEPVGGTLTMVGVASESRLSVTGNQTLGSAVGNSASNGLGVEGGSISKSSPHEAATAGALPSGHGAAADFALASFQRLGQAEREEGEPSPSVTANIVGHLAIQGDRFDHSSLRLDDNSQRADALGNTASNELSVSATLLGDGSSPSPNSALFSAQYGHADLLARSALQFAVQGSASQSGISISRNSNQALASLNDADNRLAVSAVSAAPAGTDARASIDADAKISGDHVLGNLQVASGSAVALTQSGFDADTRGESLSASNLVAEGNIVSADAFANRVVNRADLSLATGEASIGIASLQNSSARVHAGTAALPLASGGSAALDRSSISIQGNGVSAVARGNAAENQLAVTAPAGAPASMSVTAINAGEISARAPALILNTQINTGGVSAAVAGSGFGVPINLGERPASGSAITISGNTASASAYGNIARNTVGGTSVHSLPGAAVTNVQVNRGPVTAFVTGASNPTWSGDMAGSSFALTGNSIVATATGNQATNIITGSR